MSFFCFLFLGCIFDVQRQCTLPVSPSSPSKWARLRLAHHQGGPGGPCKRLPPSKRLISPTATSPLTPNCASHRYRSEIPGQLHLHLCLHQWRLQLSTCCHSGSLALTTASHNDRGSNDRGKERNWGNNERREQTATNKNYNYRDRQTAQYNSTHRCHETTGR
jgi:hypothetical protein